MRLSKIFFVLIVFVKSQCMLAFDIDYEQYKNKYPKASYIELANHVRINYFLDGDNLKARIIYNSALLALSENVREMELIQIPFSQFEKVQIKSARYYLLDSLGEKILLENVKVKYIDEKDYYINSIFYSDLKVKQFGATVPLLERTLLEYSYEVIVEDLKFLNKINVQSGNINVDEFKMTISKPDYVDLEVRKFNLTNHTMGFAKEEKNNIAKSTYKLKDIMSMKDYDLEVPPNYYQPHFVLVTKGYKKDGKEFKILSDVSDLYTWYRSLILQLNPDENFLNDLANKITIGQSDKTSQITSIFKWVQKNINYVAFEDGIAGFKPTEAHEVAQLKYGDCKGMANLLVELLKVKGFDSRHTWIGTRYLNYDYSLPSLIVDNHMICVLNFEDNLYFLDATDKKATWSVAPNHIHDKVALISLDQNFKLVKVPSVEPGENKVEIQMNSILNPIGPDGRLEVKGLIKVNGDHLENHSYWYDYAEPHERKFKDALIATKYIPNLIPELSENLASSLSEIKINGWLSNRVVKNNKKIFVYMDSGDEYDDKRNVDNSGVYFSSKNMRVFHHKMAIPQNSKKIDLPKDKRFENEDRTLSVEISYKIEDNHIVYKRSEFIGKLYIDPLNKFEWKKFLRTIYEAKAQPITISL